MFDHVVSTARVPWGTCSQARGHRWYVPLRSLHRARQQCRHRYRQRYQAQVPQHLRARHLLCQLLYQPTVRRLCQLLYS